MIEVIMTILGYILLSLTGLVIIVTPGFIIMKFDNKKDKQSNKYKS